MSNIINGEKIYRAAQAASVLSTRRIEDLLKEVIDCEYNFNKIVFSKGNIPLIFEEIDVPHKGILEIQL